MKQIFFRFVLIFGAVGSLFLIAWLPALPSSQLAAPAPTDTSTPSPMPTATATPTPLPTELPPLTPPVPDTPTPMPKPPAPAPSGANIALYVESPYAPTKAWTIVQWQDALGGWHDVEGWQGTLEKRALYEGYEKVWWVAEKDWSTGPFRWVVYESQGGATLVVSESFYLPDAAGVLKAVEVSLEP